jgi:uncharacterized membrane protein
LEQLINLRLHFRSQPWQLLAGKRAELTKEFLPRRKAPGAALRAAPKPRRLEVIWTMGQLALASCQSSKVNHGVIVDAVVVLLVVVVVVVVVQQRETPAKMRGKAWRRTDTNLVIFGSSQECV